MVRKCCGYSSAEWNEVRMWLCCGGSWIFGMILVRLFIHLDFFRLLLFSSPGFVTLAWAPLQQDRSGWRLVTFMAIMLVFYWTLIQAFPVQCRHAWGTRMVIDHDFYTNETAMEEALVLERNNFYYTAGVKHLQKQMFFPPSSKFHEPCVGDNRTKCLFERHSQGSTGTSTDDGTEFKDLITHTEWVNRTHDYARVRNWIRPLTGGLSEDFLLLRAYCNMHRQSPRTVKIYPLKVLGLSPQMINVTVPCPYWSCIMTEAHPGGKLPFGMILAFFASLNYFHYRCDCLPGRTIQMWFGAGTFRIWWAWFWASLLPLWLALLIKTTYDMELLEFVQFSFNSMFGWYYAFTDQSEGHDQGQLHQTLLYAVMIILGFAAFWNRDWLRRELALDKLFDLPMIFAGSVVHPEDHHTFQVCIWRIDINASTYSSYANAAAVHAQVASPRSPAGEDPEAPESIRQLSVVERCSGPFAAVRGVSWPFGVGLTAGLQNLADYLPMRQLAGDLLKTPDGSTPALSVRFFYGGEEIQSTRVVKPSSREWNKGGAVYFQENFRMNIDWLPRQSLRMEVRDNNTGTILSSLQMDEGAIVEEFNAALEVQQDAPWHSAPVMQVVRMLEQPGSTHEEELVQMQELRNLGFSPHRLSSGGTIWLAFAETESANRSGGVQVLCCE
mmetsp:Transcript_21412/g.59852  ORF Transcript_21412/g.59852 Transcript_21412/m.59852 type:complete len:667 (+) Transcript_21412:55-2055(+)